VTRRSLEASRIRNRALKARLTQLDLDTPATVTRGAARSRRAATTAVILVVSVSELLAMFGSGWPPLTRARLVIVPALPGRTTILTVALAAGARLPRLHVTAVVPEQLPWLAVTERAVRPAGRSSTRVTPVAGLLPLFSTRTMYVRSRFAREGSAESAW